MLGTYSACASESIDWEGGIWDGTEEIVKRLTGVQAVSNFCWFAVKSFTDMYVGQPNIGELENILPENIFTPNKQIPSKTTIKNFQ